MLVCAAKVAARPVTTVEVAITVGAVVIAVTAVAVVGAVAVMTVFAQAVKLGTQLYPRAPQSTVVPKREDYPVAALNFAQKKAPKSVENTHC